MEKKEKKFNVVLFIVLLLFTGVIPGIIYGIVHAVRALGKKGLVKKDGFVAKLTFSIICLIYALVIGLIFGKEDGGFGIALVIGIPAIIFLVLSILGQKVNRKLFNIIYLCLLILVDVGTIIVAPWLGGYVIGFFLMSPVLLSSIFGIVGVIRGLKA